MGTSRKLRAAAAALGLVVSIMAAQLAFPGAAQARCNGEGNQLTSTLIYSGNTVVTEQPLSGTCNSNKFYDARFRSEVNGWYASVWIQNGGLWQIAYPTDQTPDNEWWYYHYSDTNSNSLMGLCLSNVWPGSGSAKGSWRCGWGSQVLIYLNTARDNLPAPINGRNHGF